MNLKTFQYVQCRAVDKSDTGVKIPSANCNFNCCFQECTKLQALTNPSNDSFLRQTFLSNVYVAMLKR